MSQVAPVNSEGEPLDYFVFSINEKIGLENYSSVDVFSSLGRWINADAEEEKQRVIELVEDVLATEREKVIKFIQGK